MSPRIVTSWVPTSSKTCPAATGSHNMQLLTTTRFRKAWTFLSRHPGIAHDPKLHGGDLTGSSWSPRCWSCRRSHCVTRSRSSLSIFTWSLSRDLRLPSYQEAVRCAGQSRHHAMGRGGGCWLFRSTSACIGICLGRRLG